MPQSLCRGEHNSQELAPGSRDGTQVGPAQQALCLLIRLIRPRIQFKLRAVKWLSQERCWLNKSNNLSLIPKTYVKMERTVSQGCEVVL